MSLTRLYRVSRVNRRAPTVTVLRPLSSFRASFSLSRPSSCFQSIITASSTSTSTSTTSSSCTSSSCRLFHTTPLACGGGHGHAPSSSHHDHVHGHSVPSPVADYNKPLTLEELKKISLLDRRGNIIASPPPVIPEIAEIPSYTSDPSEWRTDFLPRDEVETRVLEVIRNYEIVEPQQVTLQSTFAELGFDSFDSVELVIGFEEEFAIEINDEVATNILSVKDAVDYIITHPYAK